MTHDHGSKEWTRRPHFAPGQRLSAQALNAIMGDELRRERLTRVALHGYGIVFGYELTRQATTYPPAGAEERPAPAREWPSHDDCGCSDRDHRRLKLTDHRIEITCGLILDRHGRDLYWPGGQLGVHDLVGRGPDQEGCYVLKAHYAERHHPPAGCGPCPTDHVQWIGQGVVFTLTWCKECPKCEHHPKCPPAQCTTLCDYVCERTGSEHGPIPPACDLEAICAEPGQLCESRCGRWRYDIEAGVPIACVHVQAVVPEHCGAKYGFRDDPPAICSVRPFVYRTPLLYELIRGCHVDLARVESLSWAIDQQITWDQFKDLFDLQKTKGFQILFTKPIRKSTLHPASTFLSAVVQERRAGYFEAARIPLKKIEYLNLNGDLASGVHLVPHPDWVRNEVTDEESSLGRGALIELTIRGQLLRDECGRMLDARSLDIDDRWSGQNNPGGDFVAFFRVARKQDQQEDDDVWPK
jgi:hypothetical protein